MTASAALLVLGLVLGLALGAVVGALLSRGQQVATTTQREAALARVAALETERDGLTQRAGTAEQETARLTAALDYERQAGAQRLADLQKSQEELRDSFALLSQEALDRTSARLVQLTDERLAAAGKASLAELEQRRQAVESLVKPLEDNLKRVAAQMESSELRRAEAFSSLGEQLRQMGESGSLLRQETEQLKNALRRPEVRGAWGELQLTRVVELAGMVEHCDFVTQATAAGDDGTLRPDLVVRLAGGKNLVVDSKVSLGAFFDALNAGEEAVRMERLGAHARHVRTHVDQLAAKAYWQALSPTPEFVVAFVPGEAMLAQALDTDPGLIEYAAAKGVLLASPLTLIAMLRTAAYAWTEERLAENAQRVFEEGRGLYKRLSTMGGHLDKLGRSLTGSVKAYNEAVGSLERQVLPSARRLKELRVTDADLTAPAAVEEPVRSLSAPELVASSDEAGEAGETDEPDAIEADPRYGVTAPVGLRHVSGG